MAVDVEAYRRHGFVVVRGLLDDAGVAEAQAAVDRLLARAQEAEAAPDDDGYGRVFTQIQQASALDEALLRLCLKPGPAAVASALAGVERLRVFLDQVLVKQPGGWPARAHQDAPFLAFDDPRSLNCWIALDPVTEANGALEYYPGSHRAGRRRLADLDTDRDELEDEDPALAGLPRVLVEAAPGDAVFHNCFTVHRSRANATDRPRRAVSIQYMPDGAVCNGHLHEFMRAYGAEAGRPLDQACFPLVGPGA